jgi:L-arabinonolactonase
MLDRRVAMPDVVCVLDAGAVVGECPLWCPREQALYWVDIRRPAVHRLDPATGSNATWPMPEDVGSLALRAGGGAVVARRSGFAFLDLATGALTPIHDPEPDRPGNRFNDGKCDRRGRFWAGTMNDSVPRTPSAALYRLDPDLRCHRMAEGITTANGLAWSPDDRVMYFADSPTGEIAAYDFDLATGALGRRRRFAAVPEAAGRPDGAAVDREGYLWSANFDGWRITRYAPDGRVDRVITLPVQRPTSCAFGGPGLDVLYVTSATYRLSEAERARQPRAGGLFALDVGVRGLPEPRFAG